MQLYAEAVLRRTRGDAYGQLNSALPCLSSAFGVLVGKKFKQGAWTNALAGFATLNFATRHKMSLFKDALSDACMVTIIRD